MARKDDYLDEDDAVRCPNCGGTDWHVRKRRNHLEGKLEYMVDCENCPNNTDWMDSDVRAVICFMEGRKHDRQKPSSIERPEADEDQSLPGMWRIRRG